MGEISVRKRNRSVDLEIEQNSKSSGLLCLVCDAPAIGFNFGVITCMCCKAFFRRNAPYGLEAYQCRYLTQNCSINLRTRRDCSYCRLNKCFSVGMKKELILTDDAKRLKREKILANRQLTFNNRTHLLKESDLIYLRNLSNAYEEYCRLPIKTHEKREYELACHQPIKSRIKFQHYFDSYRVHRIALESFFKRIPEFGTFSIEEQQLLSSHNIRCLMRINAVETTDDSIPPFGALRLLLEIIYGKPLLEELNLCLRQFKYHLNDSQCTQILLIIILFSTYTSYSGHLNTLILYKIQEKYTVLLWTYLEQRYGDWIARKKISLITRYCLQLQTLHQRLEIAKQSDEWQEFFTVIDDNRRT